MYKTFSLPTMVMLCPWLKLQRCWFSWRLLAVVYGIARWKSRSKCQLVDILQHPHHLFSDAHDLWYRPLSKDDKYSCILGFFTTCEAYLATVRNVCHCSWRSPYDVINELLATHLVLGHFRYHFRNVSSVQICLPSRYPNSSTRECGTGESLYWNWRSWMFRCCPMMRKRANKASYKIKKVTRFVCLYQLYIQL